MSVRFSLRLRVLDLQKTIIISSQTEKTLLMFFSLTAHDVNQFVRDGLLTSLII